MAKWTVFGKFNIYTGCDDLLGHVEVDGDDEKAAFEALGAAREKFPNETISHVNGKRGIMHSNESEEALFEFHKRERQSLMRNQSTESEEIPSTSFSSGNGKQKSMGGWCVVAIVVLVILVGLAMYLPPIQ